MRLHLALACMTALALITGPAQAQNSPARGPGRRMQILFQGITLTSEQQQRVDSIQGRYREQMPSFTPGSPPDSATREKIRGLFRREMGDIRAVLGADQQHVFDRNLAAMRAGRRGGP